MKSRFMVGVIIGFLCSAAALAETGYIQARQAKVLVAPEAKAEQVTTVQKGDAVEVIERQGRWVKVKAGEREGWISALLVGKNAPAEKITVLGDDSATLEQTARRRASEATSAAAARGLRSDGRARESDDEVADFGALRQMEEMGVSEDEAADFMERDN